MTDRRRTIGLVLAALAAALVWWVQSGTDAPTAADPSSSPRSSSGTAGAAYDAVSGLRWIDEADLPAEARETLDRIDRGGPYPYDQDDGTFGNFEGILPDHDRGYYREYTVDTPGLSHRGARRIVTGAGAEFYWTADHYESFERIRR